MYLQRLKELTKVLEKCVCTEKSRLINSTQSLEIFHSYMKNVKKNGGKIYVIGNGGSAGIASHFANDILKTLQIPSATLVDSNMMTCFSNDYGYEYVYSKPLDILMNSNDLLVGISSSGNSINITNAMKVAKAKKAKAVTLSGFSSSNPLRQLGDLNFWIDKSDYGLVETSHFFLLHTVADLWGKDFFIKSKKTLEELCLTN